MNKRLLEYIRHLSKQDRKTLSQKALKTVEEVGELAKWVLPYDGAYATNHRFVAKERILEEAVDTMLCALSVAYDLDFSDDDIVTMMERKSEKWASLQLKESTLTYPIPYEIHVTIEVPNTKSGVQDFRNACDSLGVKPIVLELTRGDTTAVMVDVMTSSKHYGTNSSAYEAAMKIHDALKFLCFRVLRVKIETVPWHPAAPQHPGDAMPPNCYFESHIPITLRVDQVEDLRAVAKSLSHPVHTSRNAFKQLGDGMMVQMLTLRCYTGTSGDFIAALTNVTDALSGDWNLGRVITEFSVYDTKISHDSSWLKKD